MTSATGDDPRGEVRDLLRRINASWLAGDFTALAAAFHPAMVMALPGFAARVEGRERLVGSFRDFMQQATVHSFAATEPEVEVWGDTAVATFRFDIDYEIGGERSRDTGGEAMVFLREEGRWRAVWRTQIADPSETPPAASGD